VNNREVLILDTNLLLLFTVGSVSRDLIGRHKRVSNLFVEEDFDLLLKILAGAEDVLLTPNTLTETSNMLAHIAEPAKSKLFEMLAKIIDDGNEVVVSSKGAATSKHFYRLGLTDAVLIRQCSDSRAVLLTTDFDLCGAVQSEGREAWNFNHLRDAQWN